MLLNLLAFDKTFTCDPFVWQTYYSNQFRMICKYCQCLDFSSTVCHYKCSLIGLVGPKSITYALICPKIATNITINVQQALFTNPLAAHSRVSEREPHLNTNLLKQTNSVKSPTVNLKMLILSVLVHQQYKLHFTFLKNPTYANGT